MPNSSAVHNSNTKRNAKIMATRFRKKGFTVSIFRKGEGYGISVTRRKK